MPEREVLAGLKIPFHVSVTLTYPAIAHECTVVYPAILHFTATSSIIFAYLCSVNVP